jgi:hypothetical protein
MDFFMGKCYWDFIIGDEKKKILPKNPHTTINSSQQNLA